MVHWKSNRKNYYIFSYGKNKEKSIPSEPCKHFEFYLLFNNSLHKSLIPQLYNFNIIYKITQCAWSWSSQNVNLPFLNTWCLVLFSSNSLSMNYEHVPILDWMLFTWRSDLQWRFWSSSPHWGTVRPSCGRQFPWPSAGVRWQPAPQWPRSSSPPGAARWSSDTPRPAQCAASVRAKQNFFIVAKRLNCTRAKQNDFIVSGPKKMSSLWWGKTKISFLFLGK